MKKLLSVVMCLALMLTAICVIPAVAEPTITSVMQVANCNSYVSLRISPDTKSARLQNGLRPIRRCSNRMLSWSRTPR